MLPDKQSPTSETQKTPADNDISIGRDVVDSVVIQGDNNTVNKTVNNQTIIQNFFNIFRSDAKITDQRNRRIMLGHMENFWVKGILEKSLHGVALLDLGIKEDPDALNYPWAIKREATKETLPAGTSMLEIFQEIGLGRSLLILGAPGSGKTTMLLELTRQLIERASKDVSEPIPVVFNLSSWTEKLTLADWLARELNNIYSMPRKTAPTWIKENKMILLLDGLDEVRQESRDKCVEAINQFRKENGLTSLAVSSRIQDYSELKARLSFDGAIEIQPLTSDQVDEYFKRFGGGLMGISQALERDTVLREMAETPLFLSIMTLAYHGIQGKDILVSNDLDLQRNYLFDTYIERMFKRPRSENALFKKENVIHWLSWLARKMVQYNAVPYLFENIQPKWLDQKSYMAYKRSFGLVVGLSLGLVFGLSSGFGIGLNYGLELGIRYGLMGLGAGLIEGLIYGMIKVKRNDIFSMDWKKEFRELIFKQRTHELKKHEDTGFDEIETSDNLIYDWKRGLYGTFAVLLFVLVSAIIEWLFGKQERGLGDFLVDQLIIGLIIGLLMGSVLGFDVKPIFQTIYPGQKISASVRNFLFTFILVGLVFGFVVGFPIWLILGLRFGLSIGLAFGLIFGLNIGLAYGGLAILQHYSLRFVITVKNLLPWLIVPFLDYCTNLIFLHRVGGGYIFIHRLLMEHFAAMYPADEK